MKTLRTLGISLAVLLTTATPAFAQATETDPLKKVEPAEFWFQGNWFINLSLIGTSVLLVTTFCFVFFFKVLRPKFRGRPVQ